MIARQLEATIRSRMNLGKAIILTGARQVGKTTLIRHILAGQPYLFLDGDDPTVRHLLTTPNTARLGSLLAGHKIVFIDEAQRIPGIGLTLKLITDQFSDVQLLVSGSSSFDLTNQLNEPLTGRQFTYDLFPISWEEYEHSIGFLQSEQQLENRILYGFYPDVINSPGMERELLKNLVSGYLYRDILSLTTIRRADMIEHLLQALALQAGSEVNFNELSRLTGLNKVTVQHYIDILEKGFVLFRLRGFSRSLRNEIAQTRKFYFWDTGIRNMLIGNFSPMNLRTDAGGLWENFLIAERMKQLRYKHPGVNAYFWRTRQQQEIDYIEEDNGHLSGWELKWSSRRKSMPASFLTTYHATGHQITRDNFREFVVRN